MSMSRRLTAELLGTFLLVFAGCGTMVVGGDIGIAGTAAAFGLALAAAGYAFGPASGGHFNPALTLGFVAAGRFSARDAIVYAAAQLAGAIVGATAVFGIAHGVAGFDPTGGFAANGYGLYSPGHYRVLAVLLCEALTTFVFVLAVLAATAQRHAGEFAPLVMGLAFAAVYLVSLHVDGGGANPARSTAAALYQDSWALHQLWAFWLAPLVGAAFAGLVQRWFAEG